MTNPDAITTLHSLRNRFRNTDLNWEQILTRQYCAALVEPRTVIDAGANKGAHTAYFVHELHARHVVCFEPQPKLAANLRATYPNAVINEIALSDTSGVSNFTINIETPSESGLFTRLGSSSLTEQISVRTARLDDFSLSDVDYIKIDCEGAELRVLAGGKETIQHNRPLLSVEYGHAGFSLYGFTKNSLRAWAYNNSYNVCDLFGNSLQDRMVFNQCVDIFYWDYLLIPAEKIDLTARLRENGIKLLQDISVFTSPQKVEY